MLPYLHNQTKLALVSFSDLDIKLSYRQLKHINIKELINVLKFADDVPELKPISNACRAGQSRKGYKLPFTGHFYRALAVEQIMRSDNEEKLTVSYPNQY